jgi:hypothetical protein
MEVDVSETQTHSSFVEPATAARLEAVARALEANGFVTQLVATAEEAKLEFATLSGAGSVCRHAHLSALPSARRRA